MMTSELCFTKTAPPRRNPPRRGEGAYVTKRFHPSASTSSARRSDAATIDKDINIYHLFAERLISYRFLTSKRAAGVFVFGGEI